MEPKGDLQHLEFNIPSRGLIGMRSKVLTATYGEAIMAHRFKAYEPYKGTIPWSYQRFIDFYELRCVTPYAVDKLQDRGVFFIDPTEEVYAGMVVGEHNRQNDIEVNLQNAKQLTNMRASGTDTNVKIAPKIQFSLEESMEYIQKMNT